MKYLKYDEQTGQITDAHGAIVYNISGYTGIEIKDSTNVDDLIKLKNAGFTAEEIIAIKKAGL